MSDDEEARKRDMQDRIDRMIERAENARKYSIYYK